MSVEIASGRLLPILEPLSRATSSALEPITPLANEILFIDLNEDQDRFDLFMKDVRCYLRERKETDRIPSPTSLRLRNRIPEIYDHPDGQVGHWIAGLTDFTALVIHSCWPIERIVFSSEEAEINFQFLLMRFLRQRKNSTMIAQFKMNNVEPKMPDDFVDNSDPALRLSPIQKIGVLCGLENDSFAGFLEQGCGKTAMAIATVCLEGRRKVVGRYGKAGMLRVLIVVPNQVRMNWQREFARFATCGGKVTVLRGGAIGRAKLLAEAIRPEEDCLFSAVIIGIDSVQPSLEILTRVPWDRIIADESHKFKSHSTNRFRAMRVIRDCAKWREVLTGTPIGNSLNDLWTQFEFLGSGLSGFNVYERYKDFHGQYEQRDKSDHGSVGKLLATTNVPLLQERLARLALIVTKKEAGLNLPELTHDIYEIEMTSAQAKYYEKIRDALALEIEENEFSEKSKRLTASHILTKLLRLSQITSGFTVWDAKMDLDTSEIISEKTVEMIPGGSPKAQAVLELLTAEDRDPRGKTVIWTNWTYDILQTSKLLTENGIKHGVYYGATSEKDREKFVQAFNNDPEFKVIIGNPQCMSEGLNLLGYDYTREFQPDTDTYCDHQIVMSKGWSWLQYSQLVSRAHRRGTKVPVRVTSLVCPGTIDEEIHDRVMGKGDMASIVSDIREVLSNVLSSEFSYA